MSYTYDANLNNTSSVPKLKQLLSFYQVIAVLLSVWTARHPLAALQFGERKMARELRALLAAHRLPLSSPLRCDYKLNYSYSGCQYMKPLWDFLIWHPRKIGPRAGWSRTSSEENES